MLRKRKKLKKYRMVYFLPEKDRQMKERSEMLMSELLTNFKDDILAESMEGRRRYQMITNEDGTVSFVDVTEYEQIGSEFGQAEVNAIHREINRKFDSGDVVDPLVAEESGFAADAKLTGDALREVSAKLHPVGSIYISVNPANPSLLFGGTWQQITGRFLLAAGGGYSAGTTGGEATHKLTANEIPSHSHALGYAKYGKYSGTTEWLVQASYNSAPSQSNSGPSGGGVAHNNMPPYLAVYIWKRIA